MAFSRLDDYLNVQEDGSAVADMSVLAEDPNAGAALQEMTTEEYTEGRGEDAREVKRIKFKLADKAKSLEMLGKHLKLFTDVKEINFGDLSKFSDTQLAALAEKFSGAGVSQESGTSGDRTAEG